jgi:hypothetical protein
VCGLPVALSLTVMEPVRLPEAVGANVTVITQLAPVASVAPQVLVCEKFALATMLVICGAAVPELIRVASSVSLIEPTTSGPKSKLLGDMVWLRETPSFLRPSLHRNQQLRTHRRAQDKDAISSILLQRRYQWETDSEMARRCDLDQGWKSMGNVRKPQHWVETRWRGGLYNPDFGLSRIVRRLDRVSPHSFALSCFRLPARSHTSLTAGMTSP